MNTELDSLIKNTQTIPGWLSIKEGVFLYFLSQKTPLNGIIVEIGSYKGKSTVFLGSGIKNTNGTKLFSIDPHVGSIEKPQEYKKIDTFGEFWGNIKLFKLEKKIIPIKKTSLQAIKIFSEKIDLLFIDGSHIFKDVKNDLSHWVPKVKKGGWVIIHDATVLPGPWKASKKFLIFSPKFQNIGMIGSMIFGKYTDPENILVKFKNIFLNFFSYLYIISYVIMRRIKNWIKY